MTASEFYKTLCPRGRLLYVLAAAICWSALGFAVAMMIAGSPWTGIAIGSAMAMVGIAAGVASNRHVGCPPSGLQGGESRAD